MKLYIARDKDGILNLFTDEPPKIEEKGAFWLASGSFMWIDQKLFPEVTWENSPRKVKIELV